MHVAGGAEVNSGHTAGVQHLLHMPRALLGFRLSLALVEEQRNLVDSLLMQESGEWRQCLGSATTQSHRKPVDAASDGCADRVFGFSNSAFSLTACLRVQQQCVVTECLGSVTARILIDSLPAGAAAVCGDRVFGFSNSAHSH